jgi:hypothetical protein
MFGALFAEPELFDSPGGEVYQNMQVGAGISLGYVGNQRCERLRNQPGWNGWKRHPGAA